MTTLMQRIDLQNKIDAALANPAVLIEKIEAQQAAIEEFIASRKRDRQLLSDTCSGANEQIAAIKVERDALAERVKVLRDAAKAAAEQIRKCDYTPARSTLLQALATGDWK